MKILIPLLLASAVHAEDLGSFTGNTKGGKWTFRNSKGEIIPPPPTWGTPAFSWFDPYKQKPSEKELPELSRERSCYLVLARNDVKLPRPELHLKGGMTKKECRKCFAAELAENLENAEAKRKALILLEWADVKVQE